MGEDPPDVVAAGAQDGRRGILAGAFNGQLGKAAMDVHVADLRRDGTTAQVVQAAKHTVSVTHSYFFLALSILVMSDCCSALNDNYSFKRSG